MTKVGKRLKVKADERLKEKLALEIIANRILLDQKTEKSRLLTLDVVKLKDRLDNLKKQLERIS